MVGAESGYSESFNLTTSLCLTYVLVVALLRAWIRRGMYGADDAIVLAAVLFGVGLFASNYYALSHGAGKSWLILLAQHDLSALNQAAYASVALFVISLYTSKCAVISFLLRITKNSREIKLYWTSLAVFAAVGLASLLLVTVAWPSQSGYYWAFYHNTPSCSSQSGRWIAFTVLDVVSEIALMALPVHQLWNVQMPLRNKITVIAAFNIRLPVIGLSIGRMVYTHRLCQRTTNAGLDSALVIIWLQIEAAYPIISNTFSAMRAFTMSFNSAFGLGFTNNTLAEDFSLYRSGKGGKGSPSKASGRRTLESANRAARSNLPMDLNEIKTQPDVGHSVTHVSANGAGTSRAEQLWRYRDNPADDRVIMRETEYSVRHSDTGEEIPMLGLTLASAR